MAIKLTPEKAPYYENVEPIKKYTALITQTSTNAPTAEILQNTLGAVPVWTRLFPGVYAITLTGAFPESKTYYTITPNKGDNLVGIIGFGTAYFTVPDDIVVVTMDTTGTTADGYLYKTPIEITIY